MEFTIDIVPDVLESVLIESAKVGQGIGRDRFWNSAMCNEFELSFRCYNPTRLFRALTTISAHHRAM